MNLFLIALFSKCLSNGVKSISFEVHLLDRLFDAVGRVLIPFHSLNRSKLLQRSWSRTRTLPLCWRQATNPISNLVELRKYLDCWINICCTSHAILHFKLLQLCVSRLRGFVCFFLLRRGEERTNVVLWSSELGAFAKRVICLVPPSNMVGIDHPDCDAWELTFHLVLLPRLLTPRRDNPRVEWMLSHSYECFSVHSLRWHRLGIPPRSSVWNTMLLFCEH
jgi:hypothetical protein